MKKWKCPACGRVITDKEYQKEQENGSGGYCYCEFSATDENGEVWYPRILNPMVEINNG